mmetsp:Transcript_12843/g.23900  ORF Transcript_12843/g.23900 Transcript_12843/m.23900 type:complete len:298 (+) Transcript_12843:258-1151(+)
MQYSKADKEMVEDGQFELKTNLSKRLAYSCKKGMKPESPNQDDFCVIAHDGILFLAVFDGHGPSGHSISNYAQSRLPKTFFSHEAFKSDTVEALKFAFSKTNTEIVSTTIQDGPFESEVSGTTATIVVIKDRTITFAYVGDSRGFIGAKQGSIISPRFVTMDHKPDRPDEARRILKMNGEVRKMANDIPHRLFMKGQDYPGIAVSRALGDSLAQSIGLSPEPQIEQFEVQDSDTHIVIASDGVWEFCTEVDVLNILNMNDNLQRAAGLIVNLAWERWIHHEEDLVDDITTIVFKLNS